VIERVILLLPNSKIDFVHAVMSVEIHALKIGLILAQSMGCNRVICCSDNMDVIQAMTEGGFSNRAAATILDDCYHMASEFMKIRNTPSVNQI
jgi:ribonuclease HI